QPTRALQLEAYGHPLIALPLAPRPIPINVYEVTPTGQVGAEVYTSLRAKRCSNSCILFRAGDASQEPLCSTVYRFGPNRPPRIMLHGEASSPSEASSSSSSPTLDSQSGHEETFEVVDRGCTTRAQVIRTHLGPFVWRYAGRKERQAESADSLLVLERI